MQVDNWRGQGRKGFWPAMGGLVFAMSWWVFTGFADSPWNNTSNTTPKPATKSNIFNIGKYGFPQVREQMHAACDLYNNTSVENYYIRAYEKGHLCKALNRIFTFTFKFLLSLSLQASRTFTFFLCFTFLRKAMSYSCNRASIKLDLISL